MEGPRRKATSRGSDGDHAAAELKHKTPRRGNAAVDVNEDADDGAREDYGGAELDDTKVALLQDIHAVYAGVDGYAISRQERTRLREQGTVIGSLTYGEIDLAAFAALLARAKPQAGEKFYDIGSGTGKAVLVAAALFPFAEVVGIEILTELHEAAAAAEQKFRLNAPSDMAAVKLVRNDCFKVDWTDADVLFAPCTCFDDEMMEALNAKVGELKAGARIIATTRALSNPRLELLHRGRHKYGRGTLQAFLYSVSELSKSSKAIS